MSLVQWDAFIKMGGNGQKVWVREHLFPVILGLFEEKSVRNILNKQIKYDGGHLSLVLVSRFGMIHKKQLDVAIQNGTEAT